jgi:hypothetical protein
MSNWIRVTLFILAQIAISQLVIHVLAAGLPADPINWPISLGWGSMMILPIVLSTIHYFRTGKPSPLAASALCASAWLLGFPSHFDASWQYVGFYVPSNIAIYASFGFVLYTLDHQWSAAIGWIIAVFGAVLIWQHGMVITTGEAYYERLAWCVLVALQTIQPAVSAIGRRNGTQKKSLTVSHYQPEFKKAA